MPNILSTRIDNRLIHGQVGMTWVNSIQANLVLVANDEVANDIVQQNLMDMVLPEGVQSRYFTIEKTINVIHKASVSQKIFIVIKTPQDALKLVEGGVPIKYINVGNMHFEKGKKQISSTVSLDDDDIETFKKLSQLGIELDVRGVPSDQRKNLMSLL
ncbi:MAG: PTS N-acetylgalactosamine transporter subunit IIB [Leptotrichiaceae bacterium]|nr:PTS N-acetylgalactosamine transporter subunit IIB [Leptotrichiaceae bacterium]MBP6280483.1 PTS N-acetylgalactosamine transporter subunit IIB [Leptotrichiaceae bacterium]MBP7099924.1 PTS N-acetylgalactosamine transporter subunit IIB [Leptotrichiaceae bacterium]MBP7725331.1 PTS N-acetylgalactosamine transporter subunit IIB [Leptotrichiaceae bacterium]MBP9629107.1 PTS N-acetylgalactosamine transporter subunit IIB [Leptotrichiaceae bacterium]